MKVPQGNIDLDNQEFQIAFEILKKTKVNLFLTGKAGTGKSTFLRYICRNLNKKYVILAPTGVAAVNVGGSTIHSFFQMPLRPVPPDDPDYSINALSKSKKFSKNKRKLIRELELIIIDEVSMVRADMIDFIDRALRGIRNKRGIPFGGVQLLLVGDIFQLEPVVTTEMRPLLTKYYDEFFFFNAKAYDSAKLISVELNKIYRQSDENFINLLDRVRNNTVTKSDFNLLNQRIDKDIDLLQESCKDKFGIILTTRRDIASSINTAKMKALPYEEIIFEGRIEGDFPDKLLPTDLNLALKKDAQIMLIRNDKEKRWVNGTLARIKEIDFDHLTVELENGKEEKIEPEKWENINYIFDEKENKIKEEVIGSFEQYPVKAAWALTIHKSQGLTFENVTIDMGGGAFSAGQTYVALSRCTSMEGIKFISPLHYGDIRVNKTALTFSKNFNDSQASEEVIKEAEANELARKAAELFKKDQMYESIEALMKADALTNVLKESRVQRLISRYLSEITVLKKEVKRQKNQLKLLAEEYNELGELIMEESNDFHSSLNNFKKALSIDPGNRRSLLGIAKIGLRENRIEESFESLNVLIKGRDYIALKALMEKGRYYEELGDSAKAALNYMSAMKKWPKEKEPVESLIHLYESNERWDLADQYREWLKDNFPD